MTFVSVDLRMLRGTSAEPPNLVVEESADQ